MLYANSVYPLTMVSICRDIVVIRGGGIPRDAPLSHAWVTEVEVVDGVTFLAVAKNSYFAQVFLQKKYAMLDCIVDARNKVVMDKMASLDATDDPNNPGDVVPNALKKPRRQLIDDLPTVITVTVESVNGINHDIRVKTCWRESAVLSIELTENNLELLIDDPAVRKTSTFKPEVSTEYVRWLHGRQSLVLHYYDSSKDKWRQCIRKVDVDRPDAEVQADVNEIVAEMLEFRSRRHNPPPESE